MRDDDPEPSEEPGDDEHAGARPGLPDPEDGQPGTKLFHDNLETIERAIRYVCRARGLAPDEAEEFGSHVRLKLMEDGCAVLRKFRGLSKLETFLVATIGHRLQDYRNAMWGRWRPSAKAVRLGGPAPLIQQLTARDGYTGDEAFELLRTNYRVVITRAEYEAILAQLPARTVRHFDNEDVLKSLVSADSADKDLTAEEERAATEGLVQALIAALATLPPEDRLLIRLFDEDGLTMREVARIVGEEASGLFRRRARIRTTIRNRLKERGFALGEDRE